MRFEFYTEVSTVRLKLFILNRKALSCLEFLGCQHPSYRTDNKMQVPAGGISQQSCRSGKCSIRAIRCQTELTNEEISKHIAAAAGIIISRQTSNKCLVEKAYSLGEVPILS
ncbi:hypothetical protein AVEN_90470-1 [Araneus ventricosus]|uniref:Uncharacterized protein n=1 Tax=Araneus ventricosus TaxID=182803 RepID=A0A4Y2RWF2_ARAVE|nr:hypothetical protein AVEN_90470-1 [Araneus ventricosus]